MNIADIIENLLFLALGAYLMFHNWS